jgi:hypothetical protein
VVALDQPRLPGEVREPVALRAPQHGEVLDHQGGEDVPLPAPQAPEVRVDPAGVEGRVQGGL